jgi:hypothetical protein
MIAGALLTFCLQMGPELLPTIFYTAKILGVVL